MTSCRYDDGDAAKSRRPRKRRKHAVWDTPNSFENGGIRKTHGHSGEFNATGLHCRRVIGQRMKKLVGI